MYSFKYLLVFLFSFILYINAEIRIGSQTVQLQFRKDDAVNIQPWKKDSKTSYPSLLGENEKGIFTARDLKEGDEIVSLPWYNTLSVNKVQQQVPWLFKKFQEYEVASEDALAVALLYYKYCADELSIDYTEWFNALPDKLDSGLYFTEAEVEHLKGSPAHVDIYNQFEDTKEIFNNLKKTLFKEKPFNDKCAITWDRFRWAASIVDSRKIYTESPGVDHNGNPFLTVVLSPFLDYFNHAEDANAAYDYDYDTSAIRVVALKPIKKGEQIFLNYGNQDCNSDLLIHYGFIDQSTSAKPCVNVLVEELLNTIPVNDAKLTEKTEILTKAFERNERMKFFKDSLTEDLLKISKYLSYKNYSLLPYLKALIDLKIKSYPTTLEQDRELINSSTEYEKLSHRSKMAVTMRLQEKETLLEIGGLIQEKIDQNDKENHKDENTNSNSNNNNNAGNSGRDEL